MPSARSSRRAAAIRRQQLRQVSADTTDAAERHLEPVPLPEEMAARAAADHQRIAEERQLLHAVRCEVDQAIERALAHGETDTAADLEALACKLDSSRAKKASPLDRFPRS